MEAKTKTTCPTCGSVTSEYIFRFDVLDAVLLIAMANEVRRRARSGSLPTFTAQNQVHVPSLGESLATRCRTTQCAKLGLVAKLKQGERHIPGVWVITARGWAALRGERVPAEVVVFRKQIVERSDKTVTIGEALRVHSAKIEEAMRRGRVDKVDHRTIEYAHEDWAEYGREGEVQAML